MINSRWFAPAAYHRRVLFHGEVRHRVTWRRAAVAIALGLSCGLASRASANPAIPTFEAVGSGAWRTSIDSTDRAPGFEAVAGGGELFAGVAFNWVGLAIGGRVRAGGVRGVTFVEGGGDLALQLLFGERLRVRLGAEGGRAFLGPANSWYTGGFLETTFDVVQLGGGRAAFVFNVRLDLDVYLTDDARFPAVSTALGVGFGFRY